MNKELIFALFAGKVTKNLILITSFLSQLVGKRTILSKLVAHVTITWEVK